MIYVGIDPGLDGGIAIIGKKKVVVYDIPVIKEELPPSPKMRKKAKKQGIEPKKRIRHKYNIGELCKIFRENILRFPGDEVFVILEKAQAMPDQGVSSMFSIGFGFGLYQGILSVFGVSYEIVHPKKWQKIFSIAEDTKAKAFETAQRLFPKLEFATERGRVLTGRCDSVLLAEYGRRVYNNQKGG